MDRVSTSLALSIGILLMKHIEHSGTRSVFGNIYTVRHNEFTMST
jgi:ABC-type Mn2+/Zn2+ transport system permease subunit